MRRLVTQFGVIAPLVLIGGCRGFQSSLDLAGAQAGRIASLFSFYSYVALAVYVLVMVFLVWAAARARRQRHRLGGDDRPIRYPNKEKERRMGTFVGGCVGVTVITLFVLLVADFSTGKAIHSLSEDKNPLVIKLIARQWWWEVQYPDVMPSEQVVTANEIHLPVGKTVKVELEGRDVIHSFWVPNLHGKKDMIPGHPTSTYLRADRAGVYRGQCAEFCGHQHAHMRFVVVVEAEDQFNRWLESQRRPAPEPVTPEEIRGREVFMNTTCVMCHSIAGTNARATVGPNLTHVMGRQMLAAGTIPTTKGHLGGWIADPQQFKPGVRMPPNPLPPEDFRALLSYLETLK